MKKIFLTLIFVPFICFGQYVPPQNNYNVTVKTQPSFSQSFTQGMQAGAAVRSARAAEERTRIEAMKDNYSNIIIDKLKDNGHNYKYVVVKSVTGWKPKDNINTIKDVLKASNIYGYVSMVGAIRFWTHKQLPEIINRRPELVLYLSFHREAEGAYSRTSKVTLADYKGETIFQADYKNIEYSTMLKPLIATYITSEEEKLAKNKLAKEEALQKLKEAKNEAFKKLKEAKELLDLGVITKEEYQSLVEEYKPILLGKDN